MEEFRWAFEGIVELAAIGFGIAIVWAVVAAGVRIGWTLAPYVLGLGLLAYLFF
jgi:hypothetical protein